MLTQCPVIMFYKQFFNLPQSCLIKTEQWVTSNFLWNGKKLPLKCSIYYIRCMEKTPYRELMFEWHDVFRRKRGCGKWQTTWPFSNDENWCKCGKGENSFQNISLFRHQNDGSRVRQILTNLNMKKVCVKMAPRNLPVFSQKTNTNTQTRFILTTSCLVWHFASLKIGKSAQREPFSVKWRHPWGKRSYLKHFHKVTSEDALRPERFIWGSMWLPMEITLKGIT